MENVSADKPSMNDSGSMIKRHLSLDNIGRCTDRGDNTHRSQEMIRLNMLLGQSYKDLKSRDELLESRFGSKREEIFGNFKSNFIEMSTRNPSVMDPTKSEAFRKAFVMNTKINNNQPSYKNSFRSTGIGLITKRQDIFEPTAMKTLRYESSEKSKFARLKKSSQNQGMKFIRQPSIDNMINKDPRGQDSPKNTQGSNGNKKDSSPRNIKYPNMRTNISLNMEASVPRLPSLVESSQRTQHDFISAPIPSIDLDRARKSLSKNFKRFLLTQKNEVNLSQNIELGVRELESDTMQNFIVVIEKLMLESDNLQNFDWQQFVEAYKDDKDIGHMWSYLLESIGEVKDKNRKKSGLYENRLVEEIKKNYDSAKVKYIIQKFLIEGNTNQAIARAIGDKTMIIDGKTLNPYLKTKTDRFVAKKRSRITGETQLKIIKAKRDDYVPDDRLRQSKTQTSFSKVIDEIKPKINVRRDNEISIEKLSRNPELNQIVERSKNQKKIETMEQDRLGGIFKKMASVDIYAKKGQIDDNAKTQNKLLSYTFNQLNIKKTPYLADHFMDMYKQSHNHQISAAKHGINKISTSNNAISHNTTHNGQHHPHLPFSFSIGQQPLSFGFSPFDDQDKRRKPMYVQDNTDASQKAKSTVELIRTPLPEAAEKPKQLNGIAFKMITLLRKIEMFRLTIEEVVQNKLFPKISDPPHPDIQRFIMAVKHNDRSRVISFLQQDRYIVYYFDSVKYFDLRQV